MFLNNADCKATKESREAIDLQENVSLPSFQPYYKGTPLSAEKNIFRKKDLKDKDMAFVDQQFKMWGPPRNILLVILTLSLFPGE